MAGVAPAREYDGAMRERLVGWLVAAAVVCYLIGMLLNLIKYGDLTDFCCQTTGLPPSGPGL